MVETNTTSRANDNAVDINEVINELFNVLDAERQGDFAVRMTLRKRRGIGARLATAVTRVAREVGTEGRPGAGPGRQRRLERADGQRQPDGDQSDQSGA